MTYDEWCNLDYDPDRDRYEDRPEALREDERALTWEQQLDRADHQRAERNNDFDA